ncbi:hypothetical protein LINPERHAP1_LOCUS4809 [Linum perenne]
MINRDSDGMCVAYQTGWERGQPEVKEGEAWSLLEALKWARDSNQTRVIFEVDSQQVALAVRGHAANMTEFGEIISKCRTIIQENPNFVVDFVRRDRNLVAHELARRSFSFASPHVPSFVARGCTFVCVHRQLSLITRA